MEVVRDGLSGAAERPASREWLDSFHGAEWPALPLPADTEYRADLHQRVEKLRAFLAGHLPTDDENGREAVEEGGEGRVCVYASPPRHFRARCRFALNRDDDGQLHYYLWNGADNCPSLLADDYPVASMGIYRLMPRLRACLGSDARLSDGIRAVNFLTVKDGGETVITLFYDAPLSDEWRVSARTLIVSLGSDLGRLSVQGRSKGKCILEGSDSVTERLLPCQESGVVMYRQVEGSFSNPNPAVNEKVLQWLVDCAKLIRSWERLQEQGQGSREASGSGDVLLELYSGNGNHTCVLAKFFRRVVAVEINPVLCQAAEHNLRLNGLENARVFCSPSASFCTSILRSKRLAAPPAPPGTGLDLSTPAADMEDFDSVLVDPPRSGLDASTRRAVATYTHILYISCGPDALKRDLEALASTHEVERFAAFDHFPYTRYVESAVYLRQRAV